jgi:hypothetical protein
METLLDQLNHAILKQMIYLTGMFKAALLLPRKHVETMNSGEDF